MFKKREDRGGTRNTRTRSLIEVVGTYCGKAEARHNMTPGTT